MKQGTPANDLYDPMAQALSDIHRHADEMIGHAIIAALCAGLTGLGLLWVWWPLATAGGVATLGMFLAFLDCRKARDRASVRRETIISRELQVRGGRIAERAHGFAANHPRIDGRLGDGESVISSPLVKPSA